jgi:hypothetical protein
MNEASQPSHAPANAAEQTIEHRLRARLPEIREWIIDRIAEAAVKKLNSVESKRPER